MSTLNNLPYEIAIGDVCERLSDTKSPLENLPRILENLLCDYLKWRPVLIPRHEPKYQCCVPQFDLRKEYSPPVLCIIYYRDNVYTDNASTCQHRLEQFALAIVLALASADFTDKVLPDETFVSFCDHYPHYGQRAKKVFTKLNAALI